MRIIEGLKIAVRLLTKDDIDKKYNANLNYSKISEENKKNLINFIETLFTKPDFSKINF